MWNKETYFLPYESNLIFSGMIFGWTSDLTFSIWRSSGGAGRRGQGGEQFCVLLPALTKVWLSVIPLQLNLPRVTETGAPRPARHLCTGITHLTAWRSRGESLALHRKGEEANAAQTGGFLFKASWSGFILQEFFYLSEFGQQSPQQVLTGTTSWRSRKALVSFNCQNVFFLISKSSFCYLGRGTAEVPTFRKLMRPLESEPTNPTVGFPGAESRAVTIWQFFRAKNKVYF